MSEESNEVQIGGRTFIAHPLKMGAFRRNAHAFNQIMSMRHLATKGELPSAAEIEALITVVGASLKPVGDPVDFLAFVDDLSPQTALTELFAALTKVMKVSGYTSTEVKTPVGETASAAPLT